MCLITVMRRFHYHLNDLVPGAKQGRLLQTQWVSRVELQRGGRGRQVLPAQFEWRHLIEVHGWMFTHVCASLIVDERQWHECLMGWSFILVNVAHIPVRQHIKYIQKHITARAIPLLHVCCTPNET